MTCETVEGVCDYMYVAVFFRALNGKLFLSSVRRSLHVFSKHAVANFNLTATKQGRLSSRMKDMLDVEVALDDGLPQHIWSI